MRTRSQLVGALCAFSAAAIWGGMYVVSDAVLQSVPPATLIVIRYVVALPVLLTAFVVARDRGVARRDWATLALTSLVGFGISLVAQFAGTAMSTAAAGAMITSASPAFIVLFAWPLLREAPAPMKLISLALATFGVLVITLLGGQAASESARDPLRGNVLLGIAGVSWALYTVLARRLTLSYSTLAVTLGVTAFGIPFVAPVAAIELQTQTIGTLTPEIILGILYLGIGSTALALYLWNKSFELLDAATASLFFFVQPVSGALFSAIFLQEVLGPSFFAGAVLIGLGVLLALGQPQRKIATSDA
jgi:drug/metabolite transporter (DMT)-like permease